MRRGRKGEPVWTIGEIVNWYRPFGKQYGGFLKKIKNRPVMIQQFHIFHISGTVSTRNDNIMLKTYLLLSIAALFIIAKTWKQLKCPSAYKWIKDSGVYW